MKDFTSQSRFILTNTMQGLYINYAFLKSGGSEFKVHIKTVPPNTF